MKCLKNTKRAIALALMCVTALSLSACSLFEKIPDTTSTDWGIYAREVNGNRALVDDTGKQLNNYSIDKKGNVIDQGRNIIIGADNLFEFASISEIGTEDTSWFEVDLDTQIVEKPIDGNSKKTERIVEPIESNVRVKLFINPINATYKSILVDSSDPSVVEILGTDENGVKRMTFTEEDNTVQFDMVYKQEGSANITARSADGDYETNFNVLVGMKDTPVNEDDFKTSTEPTYVGPEDNDITAVSSSGTVTVAVPVISQDIETTENTPGWVNGSKVNLRDEPSTSSNVIGTYTTGKALTILGNANGWSKVQIEEQVGYVKTVYVTTTDPNPQSQDGQSQTSSNYSTTQQGVYVSNNGSSSSSSNGSNGSNNNNNVKAPIATNDGYDHGYAFSTEAAAIGNRTHEHDYKPFEYHKDEDPSKSYTIYKCSCGDFYKGDYVEPIKVDDQTHTHAYKATVVEPTCEEIGYTEHKCECGDTYKDSFVNPLGHSFETKTDEETGVQVKECTRCHARVEIQ